MPVTMTDAFKNAILDYITGRASTAVSTARPGRVGYYGGAQAATPLTAPAGTARFSSYPPASYSSYYPNLTGVMQFADGGISAASSIATPTVLSVAGPNPAAFFRIFDQSHVGLIDGSVTVAGGGGDMILASLNLSAVGSDPPPTSFKIKLTAASGSLIFGMTLLNRLVDNITHMNTSTPAVLTGGTMAIYSGTAPASADLPATGTLLSTQTLSSPSPWVSASAASAGLSGAISITASGTGTASYVRFTKSGFTIQGSVGTVTGDFLLNDLSFVNGNTFSMTSGTLEL